MGHLKNSFTMSVPLCHSNEGEKPDLKLPQTDAGKKDRDGIIQTQGNGSQIESGREADRQRKKFERECGKERQTLTPKKCRTKSEKTASDETEKMEEQIEKRK